MSRRSPRKPKRKYDKGGYLLKDDRIVFTATGPIPFSAIPEMIAKQLKKRVK
jgi:hypothetical protein